MELLIGSALIRWNFITQRELEAGLSLASLTNLPLGKSLCALNLLSQTDLRSSVEVQSMLRDGILTEQEADRVMHLCRVKKVSLNRAFAMTGLISLSGQRSRLGQLLKDCDYLSQADLSKSLQISQKTGLPLGTVLVNCDRVHASVVETVVRYQRIQRMNGNPCDLQTLKSELDKLPKNVDVESTSDTRLGNLLREGEIITKTELMAALEISFINEKFIGELLVELAWIKRETLSAALELQKAIRDGLTDARQAARILRQVHLNNSTLQDVLEKQLPSFTRNLPFEKFLTISGLVEVGQLQSVKNEYANIATNPSENSSAITSGEEATVLQDALFKAEILAQSTTMEAIKYWQLVRKGLIPLVRAIAIMANSVLNDDQMSCKNVAVMQH